MILTMKNAREHGKLVFTGSRERKKQEDQGAGTGNGTVRNPEPQEMIL